MEIFNEIRPLKAFLKDKRIHGNSIGLVPTMGALHSGHVSLIDSSIQQNQLTVCSIYINPTQFNNANDLQQYPRTFEKDIALLEKSGCDVVFHPSNEEMYIEKPIINFDFGELGNVMEGQFRPGHFSGVALVVSKFFNIVQPDNAYFGQKDWQQFAVIQKLVDELKFGLTLHRVKTLREKDGLAMSSRNLRLDDQQRLKATVLFLALKAARKALKEGQSIAGVKQLVKDIFEQQQVRLEYFEVADSKNLNLLNSVEEKKNEPIMCIAAYVGDVRLIDNMFLD